MNIYKISLTKMSYIALGITAAGSSSGPLLNLDGQAKIPYIGINMGENTIDISVENVEGGSPSEEA